MGKIRILLIGLSLGACAHMSEYDRCKLSAGFELDATARAVRYATCEEVGNREAARQMHDEDRADRRADREQVAAATERLAESTEQLANATNHRLCIVRDRTTSEAMMFRQPGDFVALVDASAAGVPVADLAEGFRLRGGIWVENGVRCDPLELGKPLARVRLVEGRWEGTQGWMRTQDLTLE